MAAEGSATKKECILKLRLAGVGGAPQIRRVRLARITNSKGKIAYHKLVDTAVRYSFPEISTYESDDFEVILTYYDEDNDCVTIASTEELLDAIEQFSCLENPVLRITTDVKRKEAASAPRTEDKTLSRAVLKEEKIKTAEDNTQPSTDETHNPSIGRTNQLQNLVESFVSILAAAIVSLQNQVAEAAKAAENAAKESDAPTSTTETSPAVDITEEVAEKLAKEVVSNIAMTATKEQNDKKEEKSEVKKEEPKKEEEQQEEEERPFIHGRHTCDGCLCTPIIGSRYHSTNLPDYDLCGKCRDNYKGTEIQFECVELDRDQPFQERWHRKRARFAQRQGRANANGRGGPRGGGRHGGPPFRQHSHQGPPCRGFSSSRRNGQPFRWQEAGSMDNALKEAIRRSLEETRASAAAAAATTTVANAADVAPSAPVEPDVSTSETVATETESVTSNADIEPSKEVEPTVVVTESIDTSAPVTEEQTTDEIEGEETEEATEEQTSVEPDDVEDKVPASPAKSEVFSLDAAGYGEAAERLGQTLDQCAEAIDAMVSELDRDSNQSGDVEVESTTEEEAYDGDKIVDGEDNDDEVSATKSEDEWQVVDQNAQIAGDEVIARAAQMLGSALFQNDLSRSASSLTTSNMGNSDNLSVPSSVPTVDISDIPSPVLDRWSLQLNQLHELGFFDDKKSVEILEHLNAANIGVDADDEVSVTQVVNALLKN